MARKVRIQYPGAIYHVMNRGDHRESIFHDDEDRGRFLATLEECCQIRASEPGARQIAEVGATLLKYIEQQQGKWHYGAELRESAEAKAERLIEETSRAAGVSGEQLASWRKGHPFKRTLATKLRAETTVTGDWIAQRLSMGSRGHLSHLLYKQARAAIDQPTADQPTLGI